MAKQPSVRAEQYHQHGLSLLRGNEGNILRSLQSRGLFPELTPAAPVALMVNASPTQNTTESKSGRWYDKKTGKLVPGAFHEIGELQVPAGPGDGPAPNPDPQARMNLWGLLHDDPSVVAALGGRTATMVHNGWKTALEDQLAVGLAMLRQCAREGNRELAPTVRPEGVASLWGIAIMFASFSAGPSSAARIVQRYEDRLAKVQETYRFQRLLRWACIDYGVNRWSPGGKAATHNNPMHTLLRTTQKIVLMADLLRLTGDTIPKLLLPVCSAAEERTLVQGSLLQPVRMEDARALAALDGRTSEDPA